MQALGVSIMPPILGTHGVIAHSTVTGINDRGQVVGYTRIFSYEYQWGFLWTNANGMSLFGSSWPPTFATG